ncbi:hypothetical protein [Burkholderia gladioli]|nr:hypothetical protein [Burkholderia gladioli]
MVIRVPDGPGFQGRFVGGVVNSMGALAAITAVLDSIVRPLKPSVLACG